MLCRSFLRTVKTERKWGQREEGRKGDKKEGTKKGRRGEKGRRERKEEKQDTEEGRRRVKGREIKIVYFRNASFPLKPAPLTSIKICHCVKNPVILVGGVRETPMVNSFIICCNAILAGPSEQGGLKWDLFSCTTV